MCSWGGERALVSSSVYRDTSPVGPGPHPMTSFSLYVLKDPTSKEVTLGIRASTYEFLRTQFSLQHVL